MGTFTFKWPKPAEEVYVTGTFDDWSKSEKLDKVGELFQKTVHLPDSSEKIYFKFVVDGLWVTDETHPIEVDPNGNLNNVLRPDEITPDAPPAVATMSTVTPEATTAELAGEVPLEKKEEKPEEKAEEPSSLPGTFPETPANELDKEIKISPLPAAPGAVNPIHLAPGEKIPDEVKSQDINANVKLDEESYNKADTIIGGISVNDLPPVTKNMIPESSLPILGANDVTINTVTPESTTAALAAEVPLEEPKVPEVVKESQEEAGVEPEASGVAKEVEEKEAVEEELLKKVPEAPTTSEGTAGEGTTKSEEDKTVAETVSATAAGAAAAALATVAAIKDTVAEQAAAASSQATTTATEAAAALPEPVKEVLPTSVQEAVSTKAAEEVHEEVSPEVPEEVKESIQEAGESAEAAASAAAVEEKKAVETELLKKVETVEPAEPSAEASAAAEAKPEPAAAPAPEPVEAPKTEPEAPKAEPNGAEHAAPKEPETPAKPTVATSTPSTPGSSKAPESPATAEKKRKHRISGFFKTLKQKLSDKDKA